jgi:tetratricopeptide (TPR) repeat protein
MGFEEKIRQVVAVMHPHARYTVACAAAIEGRDAEALAHFLPLLDENAHSMRLSPAEFSHVLRDIAACCYRLGRYTEAEGICQRALGECGVTRRTGRTLILLAMAKAAKGDARKATDLLIQAHDLQKKATGIMSPEYTETCRELASLFGQWGQFRNATESVRKYRLPVEAARFPNRQLLISILNEQLLYGTQLGHLRLVHAIILRKQRLIGRRWGWTREKLETCLQLAEVEIERGQIDAATGSIEKAEAMISRRRRLEAYTDTLSRLKLKLGSVIGQRSESTAIISPTASR